MTPKKYEKDSMQEARELYAALRLQYDKTSIYWKRHRTFKTLGWVSTALGPSLLFAGMLTAVVI